MSNLQRRYYKKVVQWDMGLLLLLSSPAIVFGVISFGFFVQALVEFSVELRAVGAQMFIVAALCFIVAAIACRINADVYYVEVRR